MKILVDADACPRPVLDICLKLGKKFDMEVWTVASFNHSIRSDNHFVVGNDSQEADLKIMNLTRAGDVVITGDWGLAAVVLGKGAKCLSTAGREFRSDKIAFLLEEREVKARFRRGGGRTKGPKKRTAGDDQRFESCLERIVRREQIS
jgi:uncharacterized protein YaiI (UPF0178 family)